MKISDIKKYLPNKKTEQVVSDKDEQMLKLVDEWTKKFEFARNTKQRYVDIWDKCMGAYSSEYFKKMSKPDYKSDEVSNFIFSTIETIKPIMVDNDPTILALPKTPKGMGVIDKIQNIFDAEWARTNMTRKLINGVTIALQIGTAVFMIPWNGTKSNGLGEVDPILINPYNFFPDPMATSIEDAEYIIYATYKHVNILKQTYPNKASLLEGGTINYKELVSFGRDVSDVRNYVLVLECWTRDYTTEETTLTDPDNADKILKQNIRKYPNGRIITIAPESQIILEDKPSPYNDGKFPFHLLKCYDIPFEFWGSGEIEQLLSPQTYINDLTNQIIDNAKQTANMPWILDKNCGIGKGQLTNRPGLIIRKNPGTEVRREQPPQMPVYVREMVEMLKDDIEIISGVQDVSQGRKPGSVTAANAILALKEAAQARIRLKVKLMEITLGDMGKMWYSRWQQFWITNRWVRTYDEQDNVQMEEVTPQDLLEDIDFVILGGSTMPTNKNATLDLMIRLAQTPAEDGLPMVDRESVLGYTSLPNKKKIVERFMQKSQANQQAQQQMAQQQMQAQQMSEQQKQQLQMMLAQMNLQGKAQTQQAQAQSEMEKTILKTQYDAVKTDKQLEAKFSQQQQQQIMDLIKQVLNSQGKANNNNK